MLWLKSQWRKKMTEVANQTDLCVQRDGVYKVLSDPNNVYIVVNKCYFMLTKVHYDLVVEDLGPRQLPASMLVDLRAGGYTVNDIQRLRQEGLI